MNKYVIPGLIGIFIVLDILALIIMVCIAKLDFIGSRVKVWFKWSCYALSLVFIVAFLFLDFHAFTEINNSADQMNFWTSVLGQAVLLSWLIWSFRRLSNI